MSNEVEHEAPPVVVEPISATTVKRPGPNGTIWCSPKTVMTARSPDQAALARGP
ncbi:hypothetical protein [Streptomyces sp. NPDC000994]